MRLLRLFGRRYSGFAGGDVAMVRMRFAAQALDELRKLDPKTPVTLRFIKQLMRTGADSVRSGRQRKPPLAEL